MARAISKILFILGSYNVLAYLECIRSYAWSKGCSDPDLSSVYKSKFLRSEFYQKAVHSGILKNSTRNSAHKNCQLHLMISQIFIMCGLANILISGIIRYWGWHHSGTVVDKIAIFCFWIPVYCSSNITSYTSWWFCILTSFFEQHCFLFLDFWQAKCAYAFSISILPLPFLIVYTYDTWISFFVFWKRK